MLIISTVIAEDLLLLVLLILAPLNHFIIVRDVRPNILPFWYE